MAEQNVETQPDPQAPQQPDAARAAPNGKAAGEGHDAPDDAEVLKAELEKIKRAHGQLLNEKQKWTKGEAERRALKDHLKQWNETLEEHGLDEDAVREMLKTRTEADLKQAKEKGEVDKLLENQAQKFKREIEKIQGEIKGREEKLAAKQQVIDALTIDAELDAELAKIVDPALKKGAFAIHRPRTMAVEDPEARHGIRVVMEVAGEQWSIKDAIKNWAENDPEAQPYLIGNRSLGGGAPPAGARAGTIPRMKRSQMTAKQKSDFINEFGTEKYKQLPS